MYFKTFSLAINERKAICEMKYFLRYNALFSSPHTSGHPLSVDARSRVFGREHSRDCGLHRVLLRHQRRGQDRGGSRQERAVLAGKKELLLGWLLPTCLVEQQLRVYLGPREQGSLMPPHGPYCLAPRDQNSLSESPPPCTAWLGKCLESQCDG